MKIKALAALALAASTAVTVFTACDSDKTVAETTTVSETETTAVHATDYTYYTVTTKAENKTEYVFTLPPLPTEKEEKNTKSAQTNAAPKAEETTKKTVSGGIVNEESNGLSIITKTSPVSAGGTATIIIQGTPDKNYSIEFYRNEKETASYSGLSDKTADSAGYASWTFEIGTDCESGNRKIIIKEKNGNKFIQTSITVQ